MRRPKPPPANKPARFTHHAHWLENPEIGRIEKELQKIRHDHFAVQTRQKKLALQAKDRRLRKQLAEELLRSTSANQVTSRNLAEWNPYDTRIAADFFEPIWMFDRSIAEGFDLVIGNPPYIQIQKFPKVKKDIWVAQQYQTYAAMADIYCLFYERGADLLRDGGHLCYNGATNALINEYDAQATKSEQLAYLSRFYQTANAPDHPIRNRLLLTADSPDLLAVIKEEGFV